MSLDHFVLQFTKMLGGVGWVVCVNIARMCGGVSNNVHFFLCMVFEAIGYIFMVYIKYMDGFFKKKNLGSFLNYGEIVGSLYVILSVVKCAMTCEFGKGPLWGLKL